MKKLALVIVGLFSTIMVLAQSSDVSKYAQAADQAQKSMDIYWDAAAKYYHQSPTASKFHYWWSAHVLDVLVDGYQRTVIQDYSHRMTAMHQGIKANNKGTYIIDYYDDMDWLALSELRAYYLTGDKKYLDVALELWEDIKGGWNNHEGGGIAWRKEQLDYKNTPANMPAVIFAARLARATKSNENLEWAKKIYAWQRSHLYNTETGEVWDGINREGNSKVDYSWVFTYCQGIFIGGAVELYEMTGDNLYLKDAIKCAEFVFNSSSINNNGVYKAEGTGDGGLFKGILVRYIEQLINCKDLPKELRDKYKKNLLDQANILIDTHNLSNPIPADWSRKPSENNKAELSTHLSGIMLLETADRLSR